MAERILKGSWAQTRLWIFSVAISDSGLGAADPRNPQKFAVEIVIFECKNIWGITKVPNTTMHFSTVYFM
jgi:hypothetical protein